MKTLMRVLAALLMMMWIDTAMIVAQDMPPARVVISTVRFEEVSSNQPFIGALNYERISHVSSEVTGLVTRIEVSAGDRANKGMPLIHLDTEILEKEIEIHQTRVEQAKLQLGHSEKNFQRMRALYKKNGVSEKDYDDAGFVFQDARLKDLAARQSLEKLLIQKRKSLIAAPFDGIVLEKNVDSGDWVQQGKPLVTIGSVNDLFVSVPVAETLLKFVSVGQTVWVTINAYDLEMTGTIGNLTPMADEKTKNVFLKIQIPLLDRVVQNMSATVFVPTGPKQKLCMIPRDAVIRFEGRDSVFAVQEDTAVLVPVHILSRSSHWMGVDAGLFEEGMSVVVDGNERLRPGQSVTIVGEI